MLTVELPQPTIKTLSFTLIYFKNIPHNSGYSPYLNKKEESYICKGNVCLILNCEHVINK